MKKNLILVLAALAMFLGLSVMAAEEAAKDQKLVGTVALVKADDAAAGYVLKVDEKTTVAVTLDDNAKKLLKDLVGKKAELTGVVTEKDGAKTITVKAAAEVKAEAAK
jgi:hypothetical protein